jgi:hypothetical protein
MLWKSIALLEAVPTAIVLALFAYALLSHHFGYKPASELVRQVLGLTLIVSVVFGMTVSVIGLFLATVEIFT